MFGCGVMINYWIDIKNVDLVLIMGGNVVEVYLCGFKWVIEVKVYNKVWLLVVDLCFICFVLVVDYYVLIWIGIDIVFFGGLINYLLENDKIQYEYVCNYIDVLFIVKEGFSFEDGLFNGYDVEKWIYLDKFFWGYEIGEDGYVKVDLILIYLCCVFNLFKQYYSCYILDVVSNICGMLKDMMFKVWVEIVEIFKLGKVMIIMYVLGWIQYLVGVQMICIGVMVQLLLGNIGMFGGGMNVLCGYFNIQGLIDFGLLFNLLLGYLILVMDVEQDYDVYIVKCMVKLLCLGQLFYWQNYGKFYVSLMKVWFGKLVIKENNWCYDWLFKFDMLGVGYDVLCYFDMMYQGKVNGYFCQGFNFIVLFFNKVKVGVVLVCLKWMVVMDLLVIEILEFWCNVGEYNDVDIVSIKIMVFCLFIFCFVEEDGLIVNSGCWLQWYWKGVELLGQVCLDIVIMVGLFYCLCEMYCKDGGVFFDLIFGFDWFYFKFDELGLDELVWEFNGKVLSDLVDLVNGMILVKVGEQLLGFVLLCDDGSMVSGCWIFVGFWIQQGNQMGCCDNSDFYGMGQIFGWVWVWLVNWWIFYNCVLVDVSGKLWDLEKKCLVWWNGKFWGGIDVFDYKVDVLLEVGMNLFIMNFEGVVCLFVVDKMVEGLFFEYYELFEMLIGVNFLYCDNCKVISNLVVWVFKNDMELFGMVDEFFYVVIIYWFIEYFYYWIKYCWLNVIIQFEQFVEIGEVLVKELGINVGDKVKVFFNCGYIKVVVVVIKCICLLQVDGKIVYYVGILIYWGFVGMVCNGFLVNILIFFVGDGNIQMLEFKLFLVNVEKV